MRQKWLSISLFFVAITFFFNLSSALAYQPQYITHRFQIERTEGSAKDVRGKFTIQNITKQTLILNLKPIEGNAYNFRLLTDAKHLRPQETATIEFVGEIRADGKYQINLNVDVRVGTALNVVHTADLYVLVRRGKYTITTYEKLYLQPDVVDRVKGGSFNTVEDKGQHRRGPEYKRPLPSVNQMIEMDPRSIDRIPMESAGREDCRENCGQYFGYQTMETFTADNIRHTPLAPNNSGLTANVIARGEFAWIGLDNLQHPAYGWRVRAWQRNGGGWHIAAEDWIQWDGSWQISVPVLPAGGETQFQYVAFNRFFTPQSSTGETYRWVGPVRTVLGSPHNEGSWFANTATANVRGLGEIYREGMNLWSKMYWEGQINPLRDDSIRIFFPNTTYDCGNGSGNPWSCASTDGRIWLIPTHASRNGVMQHELAHQINYEYWDNQRPPGSGGSHNLVDCYNPGLAITEGFANFMVFWTQSGRGADPNSGFDFRVENPDFACDDPNDQNESWVAGAFWDLHDTRFDNSDSLWFVHPGAAPAIFLKKGKLNGMANFHPVYRGNANAEHRSIIDAIFKQDQIID